MHRQFTHCLFFWLKNKERKSKMNFKQSKPTQGKNQFRKAMQSWGIIYFWLNKLLRYRQKCKATVPSVVIFLDCPDVVVNLNPAGNVSEDPGIMLIPWTSRGGNCLRQVEPRLKFLSSFCQDRVRIGWHENKEATVHASVCSGACDRVYLNSTCLVHIGMLCFILNTFVGSRRRQ